MATGRVIAAAGAWAWGAGADLKVSDPDPAMVTGRGIAVDPDSEWVTSFRRGTRINPEFAGSYFVVTNKKTAALGPPTVGGDWKLRL